MFFCLDLVIFAQIWRRFGEKYSHRQMESRAASSSASTDPTADQTTPIRPDPLVVAVSGGFSRRKPNVIGSVPGWA